MPPIPAIQRSSAVPSTRGLGSTSNQFRISTTRVSTSNPFTTPSRAPPRWLNEFTLRMPDLKERKEDILLFANFFLDQANKELDKHLIGFDSKASQALLNYHWPGNLRQMKNIVKRATLLAQGSFITLLELGTELLETSTVCSASMALRNEETEKEHILEALRQTGNNKSKAAQLLNIDRKTLYNKLKLYNIDL